MSLLPKIKVLFFIGASSLVLSQFQNCAPVSFQDTSASQSLGDVDGFNLVSQSIEVRSSNQVDILFVVDNSGSMSEEQKNLSDRLSGFMGSIQHLDWQVALTTTSGRESEFGDGTFRPFDASNSKYVLKSGVDSLSAAQEMVAAAVKVGSSGDGNERGIKASYRAIERRDSSAPHMDFFRQNARLAVILISDEDECSNGNCGSGDALKSVPEQLIGLVATRLGQNKVLSFNSIVKKSSDCTSASTIGATYLRLSEITGGVTGSICETDYTSILSGVAQKILGLVKSANLQCTPKDVDNDGVPDVQIRLASGAVVTTGFSVQGRVISFASGLSEGTHSISYYCGSN